GGDGGDTVEALLRPIPIQHVGDLEVDSAKALRSLARDPDHLWGQIQGQDAIRPARQDAGERSGAAPHIENALAPRWEVLEQEGVVVAAVIPPLAGQGRDAVKISLNHARID